MKTPCNKYENGTCLGGACPRHAVTCAGHDNIRRESPPRSIEDGLIEMIDRRSKAKKIARTSSPAAA